MNKYEIYCTAEQTRKAFELDAPIEYKNTIDDKERGKFENPTATQMIVWLEEQKGILIDIHFYCISWDMGVRTKTGYIVAQKMAIDSRKEATLAAIDAALEYLTKANE